MLHPHNQSRVFRSCKNHRSQSTRFASVWKKMKRLKKHTHENEDNKDRLSDLSDCVLLHILSFLNTQEAVQTCLLSTRWKHIWKRLPSLTLSHYLWRSDFNEFWNRILSLRDDSVAVNALNFMYGSEVKPDLLERIIEYAVSHNVNTIRLTCIPRSRPQFPRSLFSCLSLTSLDIASDYATLIELPNSLNFPALKYLKLHYFSFCSGNDGRFEPFSTFNRLNTLILYNCVVPDEQTLYISSTTLLNLTIYSKCGHYLDIELCTTNLCTFTFEGGPYMSISGSDHFSIEQVTIDLRMPDRKYSVSRRILLNWLIALVSIKSLTVSEHTLQAFSTFPDLLKLKSPSWYNLKSLKLKVPRSYGLYIVNQRDVNLELAGKSMKEKAKLRKASKIIDFFLQNSPSAKVDTIW